MLTKEASPPPSFLGTKQSPHPVIPSEERPILRFSKGSSLPICHADEGSNSTPVIARYEAISPSRHCKERPALRFSKGSNLSLSVMLTKEASQPPSFRARNEPRNLFPFNGCYPVRSASGNKISCKLIVFCSTQDILRKSCAG
jgi:hypothetical protein